MANFNWQKLLNKSWTYTKVFFAVLTLMVGSYFYGTYYPNKSAIAEVNAELDKFYMNKKLSRENNSWEKYSSKSTHYLLNWSKY